MDLQVLKRSFNLKTMSSAQEELQAACFGGDCEKFMKYVTQVDNLNFRDYYGKSLLHFVTNIPQTEDKCNATAVRSRLEIMKILLEKGVEIDCSDKEEGQTPLHMAAYKGFLSGAKLLIQAGADINAKTIATSTPISSNCHWLRMSRNKDEEKYNSTPLHLASMSGRVAMAKLLLQSGADPTLRHTDGQYDIHYMSDVGDEEVIKLLLDKGVPVDVTCSKEETPLFRACLNANLNVAKLLLERGADPFHRNAKGQSLMSCGIKGGNVSIVKLLVDLGIGFEKIVYELTEFHERSYSILLEFFTSKEALAFYRVIFCGELSPQAVSAFWGYEDIFEYLLQSGLRADHKEDNGFSIIHFAAACRGKSKIISTILSLGIDVNVKSDDLKTPLHVAAMYGHIEACKLLMGRGASTRHVDKFGKTVIKYAIKSKNTDLVKMLLEEDPELISLLDSAHDWDTKSLEILLKFGDIPRQVLHSDTDLFLKNFQSSTYILLCYGADELITSDTNNSFLEKANKKLMLRGWSLNYRLIIGHAIKLKAAGLACGDRPVETLIVSDKDYYNRCVEEVKLMQKVNINVNQTLYNFLCCPFKTSFRYIQAPETENCLLEMRPFKNFPHYSALLTTKLDRAIQMKYLHGLGSKFFSSLDVEPELPYDCIETILSYLDISSLLALERAIVPSPKKIKFTGLVRLVQQSCISRTKDCCNLLAGEICPHMYDEC